MTIKSVAALRANPSLRLRFSDSWAIALAIVIVDIVWIACADWSLDWEAIAKYGAISTALLPLLAVPRYRRDTRVRASVGGAALLVICLASLAILSYLAVSTNAQLVDEKLSQADAALSFDWMELHNAIAQRPWLAIALQFAYLSGVPQMLIVVLVLAPLGQPGRVDEFLRLFIVACLVTILISAFFPAAGAWKQYGPITLGDPATLSHFEPLRDGTLRVLSLGEMQGLVSIPSLHSAMALLLVWAVRGTVLFGPSVLLNTLMLASTPTFGGHYLVDVIAGVTLAMVVIAADRYLSVRRAGLATGWRLEPPITKIARLYASPSR